MSDIIFVPGEREFRRQPHHRRLVIQYPPDAVDPLFRCEVIYDERDKKAVQLANECGNAIPMLALKRLLDENSPLIVRTPRR